MAIIDYPFQSIDGYICPALPVRVVNPDTSVRYETYGIIDTGANASIIPGHIATTIDHNVRMGKKCGGSTGSGDEDVFEHTCRIDILGIDNHGNVTNDVLISIPNRGKYIGVMEHCPFVLLGVDDFLHKYVLTIDYPRQVFSILKSPKK